MGETRVWNGHLPIDGGGQERLMECWQAGYHRQGEPMKTLHAPPSNHPGLGTRQLDSVIHPLQ